MNFFVVNSRQDYASYSPNTSTEEINEPKISAYDRRIAHRLEEYLGDPPRKPGKRGDFHMSSFMYFVRTNALRFFETAAREKILMRPIAIVGRQSEEFRQIWVTNFIDCLDLNRTIASPPLKKTPGKIGIIKKPVFDEARWDGSDLFVVPQDSNSRYFCTENFVTEWKAAKFKGAMFSRFLFDPDPIIS